MCVPSLDSTLAKTGKTWTGSCYADYTMQPLSISSICCGQSGKHSKTDFYENWMCPAWKSQCVGYMVGSRYGHCVVRKGESGSPPPPPPPPPPRLSLAGTSLSALGKYVSTDTISTPVATPASPTSWDFVVSPLTGLKNDRDPSEVLVPSGLGKDLLPIGVRRNRVGEKGVDTVGSCLHFPRCRAYGCCPVDPETNKPWDWGYAERRWKVFNHINKLPLIAADLYAPHLYKVSVTRETLGQLFVDLPPVPLAEYDKRNARLRALPAGSDEVRIAWTTGNDHPTPWLTQITDARKYQHVFRWEFEESRNTDKVIFMPRSVLADTRSAAIAAVRLQELRQGWLYDFVVQMDADAGWEGNPGGKFQMKYLANLEQWLRKYEPAFTGACWSEVSARKTSNPPCDTWRGPPPPSMGQSDFRVVVYHREAVDMLFPFVTEYDKPNWLRSQVLQLAESFFFFQRHMGMTGTWVIESSPPRQSSNQHNTYPGADNTVAFGTGVIGQSKIIDPVARGCLVCIARTPLAPLLVKDSMHYHLVTVADLVLDRAAKKTEECLARPLSKQYGQKVKFAPWCRESGCTGEDTFPRR